MAKDDETIYWVSTGTGRFIKLSGWSIRTILGGLGKIAARGWTILEDRSDNR